MPVTSDSSSTIGCVMPCFLFYRSSSISHFPPGEFSVVDDRLFFRRLRLHSNVVMPSPSLLRTFSSRTSPPPLFLSTRLKIFHPFFISLSPLTPATSRLLFLINFYFMRFESPRHFRRPFFLYFASISLSFHVESFFLTLFHLFVFLHLILIFQFRLFLRLFPVNFNMASRPPTSSPGSSSTTAHIPVPSHFSSHPTPFGCKLNVRGRILFIFHCVFAISSEFTHPCECLKFA